MNTIKVRRKLAVILVGVIGASVGVLGLAAPASADVIWIKAGQTQTQPAQPGQSTAPGTNVEKDVIWI